MAEAIEAFLDELRRSQTDLGRLVAHVLYRQPPEVNLLRATVGRWERREPETWEKVREWLTLRGVAIRIL
jgi:hypothetical protein